MKRIFTKRQIVVLLFLLISKVSFGQGWSKVIMVDSEHESRPTTFIIDDSIYMGRGDTGFFQYSKTFWNYSNNSRTWTRTQTYPGQGSDWGYSFVINHTAYVGGGAGYGFFGDFWKYTPSGGWTSLGGGPNSGAARGYAAAFVINDVAYVGTGLNGSPMSDFWSYDTLSNSWTQIASFPAGGRLGTASFAANGYGYVGLGGDNSGKTYRDIYRYDPVNDVWDTMLPMPSDTGMEEPAYFTLCGKLIVTCGDSIQSGQRTTKQAWLFDPTIKPKGRWHRLPDFIGPLPAYAPGGFTFKDTGYVYGGYDYANSNYYWAHMYRFIPTALNMWMIATPLDTTICAGNSVTLSGSGATSFLWNTTDTTFSVVVAPKKDTIYTVSEENGTCIFIDTVHVNVSPGLSLSVTPDPASVCNGQKITLVASGGLTYQWVGTADTTDSITVNPSQDTTYELLAGNGSCNRDTFISVSKNNAPPLFVQPQFPSLCLGQSIILTVPVSGSNYTWSPAPALHSTTGDSVLATPTVTTTYTVSGIDSLACSVSDTDVITVSSGPSKPVITQNGNVLTSSATQGNQWQLDDVAINGATNQTYTVTTAGWYTVTAENPANGCSTTSDSLYVTPSGINQLSINNNQLSIYPNPTLGEIYVNINSSAGEVKDWNLQITDVLGRIVYTKSSLNYSNEIDLSNQSGGVYFISVINKTGRAVVPVVKQN